MKYVIMYVSDQSNTQKMCDEVILENGGMLRLVPYKNQKGYHKESKKVY